jgi:hypothetical protein
MRGNHTKTFHFVDRAIPWEHSENRGQVDGTFTCFARPFIFFAHDATPIQRTEVTRSGATNLSSPPASGTRTPEPVWVSSPHVVVSFLH